MNIWADKIQSVLSDNCIMIYLLVKYIDDINLATALIPTRERWVKEGRKWRLRQCGGQKEEDLQEGKTPEESTMQKILWVGDGLVPGIKLTMDCPQYHSYGKCPMLDLQVWVDKGTE